MQSVNRLGAQLARSGRPCWSFGAHVVVIYLIATSLGHRQGALVRRAHAGEHHRDAAGADEDDEIVKPDSSEPQLDIPQPDTSPIPEVEVPVEATSASRWRPRRHRR